MDKGFDEKLKELRNDFLTSKCPLKQYYRNNVCYPLNKEKEDEICKDNCKYANTYVEIDIHGENGDKTVKINICDLFDNMYF